MTPFSLSFVIPMYNEADAIRSTVKELKRIAETISGDYEIIIADDASSDGSGLTADEISSLDTKIRVIHLPRNTKFGGALKAGLGQVQKDIAIYTDSDLPIDEKDIKGALDMLEDCDVVTAYSTGKKGDSFKRVIMSKVYNFLVRALFGITIKDINSGFKIYRKKVIEGMKLASESPFVDVEIFVKAMRKNCVIKPYPVVFKNRDKGKSSISRPAVVFKTLLDMLAFKFRCRN